ncbi:MAG: carboxypeptidase-like regulatory domain-containing protein [Bacteroidetes bacterium]|nr:carboxypeptidase-like regulatory domain-containing protein [Bacteroidota bacterium]
MNANQMARYKAYALSLAHLKQNEAITATVPAFATIYESAKATLDALESADKRKAQKLKGIAEDKSQYQEDLALQANAIAAAIGAYALQQKDAELKQAMNFTVSELFYGPNKELTAKSANILAKAQELVEPLKDYGVSELLISNFAAALDAYAGRMHKPRNVTAERKVAVMQIAELLKQLQVIFTGQLDALMLLFQFTHPEFYNEYKAKRSLVNPARRKTRVEGVVTDKATGAALTQVSVTLKDGDSTGSTAQDGSYSLPAKPLGMATVVYEKEGYKPVEATLPIRRGQAEVMDIEMEPK